MAKKKTLVKTAPENKTKKINVKAATGKKHPGGRPTAYKSEYATQVLKLCLLGAKDKEIADFFGVSEQTVNGWKKLFPEFLESIKRGKMEADANVASSLYNRAIGFTKKDCEKVFQFQGNIVRAKVTEYFPPSETAGIFWLKNRQPDKFRDKQTNVLQNPDGSPIVPRDVQYDVKLDL